MQPRNKGRKNVGKPLERRLSEGLETLLDTVFDNPSDLFSLYWDIAALLRDDERILVQKKIRRVLRKRGAISPESALLSSCILSLSGFPAHRVLHFLSIYFTGSLNQSLFDLAASTIFLGDPPLAPSLMYDMTQYTYLEKRLLARRSFEISEQLKESLSPELLLYLYLLSLRADLSNENIQLIALVMKNCFPAQELRTRLGVASLEEYGEIARAWREAEERTIAAEQPTASGAGKTVKRGFNLDKASFFLDKYFSDAALEKMHAEAPPLAIPKRPPRIERSRAAASDAGDREPSVDLTASAGPSFARTREPLPAAAAPRSPRKAASGKASSPQPGFVSRSREAAPGAAAGPLVREAPAGLAIPPRPRGTSPKPGPAPRAAAGSRARRATGQGDGRSTPMAGRRGRGWLPAISPGATLTLAPFILAVLASGALVCASWPFPVTALAGTAVAPAADAAAPAPADTPASPSPAASGAAVPAPETPTPPQTYVVQEGDSLWTIFKAMGGSKATARGWVDFLSLTRESNSLKNPDRIMPGKTLTLPAPGR